MRIRAHALIPCLAFLLVGLSAPAAPADQEAPVPAAGAVTPGMKIVLLRPSTRFEDVKTGAPLPRIDASVYDRVLLAAAERGVGPDVPAIGVSKLEPAGAEACGRLDPLASKLARGDVNDDARAALGGVAALDSGYAVLVQFFRIRTGPGSSWNMYTGGITSSTDSTLIQAALVSASTGHVIWKGERLIRNKALKATDPALTKELALLYRNLDVK